jgi:hypothetical protein
LIVVAGGTAYVVDPRSRTLVRHFGGDIADVVELADREMLIFGNGLWFEAMAADGIRWRSERISWDGMRRVRREGDVLKGEAYDPIGKTEWSAFEVDVSTGESTGGSYNGPSM